jgi:hypothetical protein
VKLSNNGDSIRTEQLVSRLLSITQVTEKLPYCRGELTPIAKWNAFVSTRLFAKRNVSFGEYMPARNFLCEIASGREHTATSSYQLFSKETNRHVTAKFFLSPFPDCVLNVLTYSTEQSPSWEANQFSASQEIPPLYGTRSFTTAFTRARHLSLYEARSVQSMTPQPTS